MTINKASERSINKPLPFGRGFWFVLMNKKDVGSIFHTDGAAGATYAHWVLCG